MDPKMQAINAVQLLTPLVDAARSDQLDNQTPCAEWKVRDLLNHVIGGGHMFAAGLRGESIDGEGTPPDFVALAGDHRAAFSTSINGFSTALAEVDSLDKLVTLPFGTMPANVALQLAAGDLLVHSWDLAQATGQSFDPPADFVAASYDFFKVAVNDDLRNAGMFASAIAIADDASPLAKLLAYAGREA